jgi:glycerol-3-phosphate O-acyltransferase / dihydroxyacetone phosphate acyltransferase
MQIKDGAAWAALESMKFARDNNKPVPIIIVAGLVYTNKSKYRSNVVLE